MSVPSFFESYRAIARGYPPAITSGIALFMFLLLILETIFPSLEQSLRLTPSGLKSFEMNRLTFYPMLHLNILHYLMNMWAFLPLLKLFELNNGTVRTGIVLNLLATIAGVGYCLIELLLGLDTPVIGSSIWAFAFLGYYSWLEYLRMPQWQINASVKIPTYAIPVIPLLISTLAVPKSSFLGHVLGILAGYILAAGYIKVLYEPSTNVVEKIESKLTSLIALIPHEIKYITEVQARDIRSNQHLPVAEDQFPGTGEVLGS